MAVLHVRNVPEPLYRRAQSIAEARGSTLSDLVIDLMQQAARRDLDSKRHVKTLAQMKRNLAKRRRSKMSAASLVASTREERESDRGW